MSPSPRLRSDLPFQRIAVVLPGGGALGAYQAGVLRVLSRLGVRPTVLAGTSTGAINAVVWRAHDFDSRVLERAWSETVPGTVGIRWATLLARSGGLLIAAFAIVQALLTVMGSPAIGVNGPVWMSRATSWLSASAWLDLLAWVLVAALGVLTVRMSRVAEEWLARFQRPGSRVLGHTALGWALVAGAAVHLGVWILELPWPHRFSAVVLLLGSVLWLINRPGRTGTLARQMLARILPETGGRGLWGAAARRHLLRRLVREGNPQRLSAPGTTLLLSALALDSGRIAYFVAGDPPTAEFKERVERALGEVVHVHNAKQVIEAAVASSAIPLAFEPVMIRRREFVDAGQFSNQPVVAAIAVGVDAVLVVLMAPRTGPRPAPRGGTMIELGARMLEIASWRELQLELGVLSTEWATERHHGATRLCVVEPESPIGNGLLAFEPRLSVEMMRRGESDAIDALERCGWLDPRT